MAAQLPAREVSFVSSIAFDNAGNLYLADEENFVVRKISTDGTISTVAGNGMQGSSGDGGSATASWVPSWLAANRLI
jgi:hypothetical protein